MDASRAATGMFEVLATNVVRCMMLCSLPPIVTVNYNHQKEKENESVISEERERERERESKGGSGFTLLELLVVIAILAVLSGVAIIVLNPAELLKRV